MCMAKKDWDLGCCCWCGSGRFLFFGRSDGLCLGFFLVECGSAVRRFFLSKGEGRELDGGGKGDMCFLPPLN